MKRFIALIALTSIIACVSCGEKTENSTTENTSSNIAVEDSSTTDKTTDTESTSVEESTVATEAESSEKDEDYFNWFGINTYLPSEYTVIMSEGFPQASKDSADGVENNIVYYTLAKDDLNPMTAETVKDYMYESAVTFDALAAEFKGYFIDSNDIESEEPAQINGGDFIRQAGIYHITDFADKKDVAYVAYFGVMDFPEFGKQPTMIIAFSHKTDDEMKAELARLVDTITKDAKPIA
jgi:hypothetical protein